MVVPLMIMMMMIVVVEVVFVMKMEMQTLHPRLHIQYVHIGVRCMLDNGASARRQCALHRTSYI